MGREVFLIVLAALTAICGVALLIMMRRRRALSDDGQGPRGERDEATRPSAHDIDDADSVSDEATGSRGGKRRIDDYAIPVSFERARDLLDDEVDIGKICPRCGARYGSHHRFCERDNSELAALN